MKTGKEINFPYSCCSEDCPKKKHQQVNTDRELSVEELMEKERIDSFEGFNSTGTTASYHLLKDNFITFLKKAGPILAEVFVFANTDLKITRSRRSSTLKNPHITISGNASATAGIITAQVDEMPL